MGRRIAMGTTAAHALDLAAPDPVHEVDTDALQERLHDNLERTDCGDRPSTLTADEGGSNGSEFRT